VRSERPPWALPDIEPESVLKELRHRFPWTSVWWGPFTGSWWAVTPVCDRLVEAASPKALADRLEELGARDPYGRSGEHGRGSGA
jgi:hypothetical protein